MSTVKVTQKHSKGAEAAKQALGNFEQDIQKYGMKLSWSGTRGELKGTGASGDIVVSDDDVTVTVKLGLLARAVIDADRLHNSIAKRLKAALEPS